MAVVPIEVVRIADVAMDDVTAALALANSVQKEFFFIEIPDHQATSLQMYAYTHARSWELLDTLESFRKPIRGYHPFLIAIVDAHLDGMQYGNLFGSHRAEKGIAVATVANVPDIIVPKAYSIRCAPAFSRA